MWLSLKRFWRNYRFSSVIFANFSKIFMIIFLIIAVVSVFLYNMKTQNTKVELTAQTNNVAQGIHRVIADGLDTAVKAGGNLAVDTDVRTFIYTSDASGTLDELRQRITNKLTSYKSMVPFVSSVYVYSEKRAYSVSIGANYDEEWMEYYFNSNENNMIIVPRGIMGSYPKMITIIFIINTNSSKGAVVVNCDYSLINRVIFETFDIKNDLYIMSDDNIIYSSNGRFSGKSGSRLLNMAGEGKTGIVIDGGDAYSLYSDKMIYNDWKFIDITKLDEYDTLVRDDRFIIGLILITLFVISMIISFAAACDMTKPIYYLFDVARAKSDGDMYSEGKEGNEVKYIATKIIGLIDDNEYLKNEINDRLRMYNELQIAALQTQINPHFLSNALNMVNMMAAVECGDDSDVSEAIRIIAGLMRYSYITGEVTVSIRQEAAYLEDYIKLVGVCYPDITINMKVDDTVYNSKIIRMCIQPLVENSIYHGRLSRTKDGKININIEKDGDFIKITVSDNGTGMDIEKLKSIKEALNEPIRSGLQIGIGNVYKRLSLVFGEDVVFEIQSNLDAGTKTEIIIPDIT